MHSLANRIGSVNNSHFSVIPQTHIRRTRLRRFHRNTTTFDAGFLYPVYVDEVLPGDTFDIKMDIFGRLNTLVYPLMDGLELELHAFFVANRLTWQNWKRFMGEQKNPGDSTDFQVPIIDPGTFPNGFPEGGLFDYMGIPTKIPVTKDNFYEVQALFGRSYNLIWNEWYRDQNLQDSAVVPLDDAPDSAARYVLLPRAKRRDYYTSCLPAPQKGPAVDIPLGSTAPISGNIDNRYYCAISDGTPQNNGSLLSGSSSTRGPVSFNLSSSVPVLSPIYPYIEAHKFPVSGTADLSQATAVTINALRQAFQIQKMYERDARGGTRYTEILRSHFGVISPDARLQRPEFLGASKVSVHVQPVPQTSGSVSGGTPQATLAAFGVFGNKHRSGFSKSFVEHGILMVLLSVRSDVTYQQGLHKMFSRRNRFDYFWPSFVGLGEQAVLNKEIYLTSDKKVNDDVFGYQERFAEYRFYPSYKTGKFRSNATGTLDSWHLAQNFTSLPKLNSDFIVENPPLSRVLSVGKEPAFSADVQFSGTVTRPMPLYCVPGNVDRF